MNSQNHPQIHKSLVLAHNIHKDCPLGVVRSFYHDIWCEALSFIICSEGSFIKKVPIWRFDSVPKTLPRSHMDPQNHPKLHKSLVLAHNINKDCLLGVVRSFSDDIWCEALSFIICSEGPEGENQGFNAKVFQINFKCFVLEIYESSD